MTRKYLTKNFYSENDNSVEEYKRSLIEYLFEHLEDRKIFPPVASNEATLDGAKDMLREVIETLNGTSPSEVDHA